jgi:hypothetical protein
VQQNQFRWGFTRQTTRSSSTPDFSFLAFSRRYVIIAYDAGDVKDNFSVKAARHQLTEYLLSMEASVGWLEWNVKRNGREAKGVDDWLAPLIGDSPTIGLVQ